MILVKLLFDTPEYISDVDYYDDEGVFYSGDLVNLPSLQDRMLSESYGIAADKTVSIEISNRDNYWSNLVQSSEIRGKSVSILRKDSDGASFSYFGTITKYSISKTVMLTLSSMDSQIFNKKIPAETTTTELFTENGLESGVPINVCFGICINVPLCTINNDIVEDKYDYLIGYGPIEGIYTDSNQYGVKRNGHLVNSEEYLFYDGSQSTPYPGFAFLRFGTEQRDFTGNFYTLSADIKGLTMGGASAERNFINVIGHILSNSTWGLGQSIDPTSFGSEATYLSTKLYCDGVVSSETDSGDLLNTLLTLSRSVLSRTQSGAIGIYTEKPKTSILTLGSNDGYYNNAQTNEIYSLDANQLFKKITVNYGHRPDEEYEDSKTAYTENEIYLDCYENFGKEEKISLEFVEDHDTAKDILSFMRNKNLYGGKFISAKVSLEGKELNRGDLITYIDPKYQINADYLVSAISKNLKDQYTLTLRKYDSRFYTVETIEDPIAPVTATTIKMNSLIGDISLGDGELQSGRIRLLRAPGFGDVYLISGKTDFTQLTQDGFVIGIDDSDGLSKFFFSNNQDPDHPALIGFDGEKPIILSDNFNIEEDGTVRINGSFFVGPEASGSSSDALVEVNLVDVLNSVDGAEDSISSLMSLTSNSFGVTIAESGGNAYVTGFETLLYPQWFDSKAYVVGDMITFTDGLVYNCILDHTSSSENNPLSTNGGTYWEVTDRARSEFNISADHFNVVTADGLVPLLTLDETGLSINPTLALSADVIKSTNYDDQIDSESWFIINRNTGVVEFHNMTTSFSTLGAADFINSWIGNQAFIDSVMSQLIGNIEQDHLYLDLSSEVDKITGDGEGSVNARIAAEALERANADDTIYGDVTTLDVSYNDPDTGLSTTVTDLVASHAQALQQLSALATADEARTESLLLLSSEIGNTQAAVEDIQGTIVDETGAYAWDTTTIETNVGGLTTSVQTMQESIDGMVGKYTVKVDNNGYVSGFGLLSEPNEGTTVSTFTVLADKFMIITPGDSPVVPFSVGTVDGISTVGINGNLVVDGTIKTSSVAPNSITTYISAEGGDLTSTSESLVTALSIVDFDTRGGDVMISYLAVKGANTGDYGTMFLRLFRDSTELKGIDYTYSGNSQAMVLSFMDPGATGVHSYHIKVANAPGFGGRRFDVSHQTLNLISFMR